MKTAEFQATSTKEWSRKLLANGLFLSFVTMFVLAMFAEIGVRQRLIMWDDPMQTALNISENLGQFDGFIFSFFIILILDVFIALAFYLLLQSQGKGKSALMSIFRLVYVAIKGAAMVGLIVARELIVSSSTTGMEGNESAISQAMQFLQFHDAGFELGLVFFGVHLILLAVLMFQLKGIPNYLAWIMLIGGIAYLANSLSGMLLSEWGNVSETVEMIAMLPMTIAELSFAIWLFVKRKSLDERWA